MSEDANTGSIYFPPGAPTTGVAGVSYFYQNPITSTITGYSGGSATGTCTIRYRGNTTAYNEWAYCVNSYTVDGLGEITTQGDFVDRGGERFVSAITGGTGAFRGASGVMETHIQQTSALFRYIVKLDKPYACPT